MLDNNKVIRTISHKIEASQILWLVSTKRPNGDTFFDLFSTEEAKWFESKIPVFVETENPDSRFYATSVSNSSLLDRNAYPEVQYRGIVKQVDTSNGVNYEYVDTLVHDARGIEVTIKKLEYTKPIVLSIKEEDLKEEYSAGELKLFRMWEPSYATSSQTRKGELVAKRINISYTDYFNRIGFDIKAFEKKSNGRVSIKSIDKMSKRVKQTASSSKERKFFRDWEFQELINVEYNNTANNENKGKVLKFKKEEDTAKILIIPGFFVKQNVDTTLINFLTDNIEVGTSSTTIIKDALDGSHMIDRKSAIKFGLSDPKDVRTVEQIRWGQAIKGLFVIVDGLKEMLGFDIVLAEGGIKGDAVPGLIKGNMPFAVLNRGREEEVNPSLKLSRQVTTNNQNKEMIDILTQDTKDLIDKVLSLDDAAIRDFLKIKDYDVESEEEINVDQLTTRMYAIGRNTFMKSHTMKKKMIDLLNNSLKTFSNGSSLYLKDASFKHMIVDPYAICYYLKKGINGLVKEEVKLSERYGVQEEHVLVAKKIIENDKEKYIISTEKAFLFRFPFLHKLEGRIVNKDKHLIMGTKHNEYYRRLVEKGYIQGVAIYSLWDMNAEAQSGADYDGDQTGYTTNPIVEYIDNQENRMFLDYSMVNGELISGCPFTINNVSCEQFLNSKDIQYMKDNDIVIEKGGISGPEELSGTTEWINLVGKLGAYLARHTLEGNNIGRFTNISLTVKSIISELELKLNQVKRIRELEKVAYELEKEIKGYEKLMIVLTAAIRWEVDKAKHGGAYIDKFPFLKAILEDFDLSNIVSLEDKYHVSLQRLCFGSKLR